jgi:hypothetical protein
MAEAGKYEHLEGLGRDYENELKKALIEINRAEERGEKRNSSQGRFARDYKLPHNCFGRIVRESPGGSKAWNSKSDKCEQWFYGVTRLKLRGPAATTAARITSEVAKAIQKSIIQSVRNATTTVTRGIVQSAIQQAIGALREQQG